MTTRRLRRPRLLPGVLALGLALAPLSCSSASTTAPATTTSSSAVAAVSIDPPRSEHPGRLGVADGVVPEGTTVADDDVPAVALLDPGLRAALREATAAAAVDGVGLEVNSGWRSPAYQDHLLREAIAEHGSAEEAARWVATAETSAHVAGDAVDVGPPDAARWLDAHGAAHGLCRVYDNEPWHFELRPQAIDLGCPPRYADPTDDPRMRPR